MRAFTAACVAVCAMAAAFVALPARSAGPVSKPTPTPTPVAIGYDEINRNIMDPATPPPPGSFADDYTLAMQGVGAQNAMASSMSSATPTPAPKKRGFGGLMSSIANPMGNASQGEAGPGGPSMMGGNAMMDMIQHGQVVRYTWYWVKNWIREDDPVTQTAIIHKCPQNQDIYLDMRAKTYRIVDTSSSGSPCDTSGSAPSSPSYPGRNMGPGTVDINVSSTSDNLGPKTLEGVATRGNKSTMTMSMTNATGSCQNMQQMSMIKTIYVSSIGKPRPYCPLRMARPGGAASGQMPTGGCKFNFHGSMSGNPLAASGDKLEMYILNQMQMAQMGGRQFGQLTERGHVNWYYKPEAEALFAPPPDFTKAN